MPGIPVFNLAGTAVSSATVNTVAWPSHATNDVALLLIQTDAEASSLVTAAGFASVTAAQSTGTAAATNAVALQMFWKRATGTAEANVTLADAGSHTLAVILTFTNVATTGNPWNAVGGGVKATASTNCAISQVTTVTADSLIVAVLAGSVDTTTAQVSTWTNAGLANPAIAEIVDTATTTGGGGSLSAAAGGLKLKGATGTTTATLASSSKNAFLTIALSPIEPTGTGTLANPVPSFAGTGIRGILGTGTLAVPVPAHAGTGRVHATFAQVRQDIINGLDSAQSEASGWNAAVRDAMAVGAVVRTSDTVVTITVSAFTNYDITAQETITVTIPASAVMEASAITATPTFTIATVAAGVSGSGSAAVAIPTMAGTGIRGNLATGALAVAIPTLAATGTRGNLGTGSFANAVPAFSGTGQQQHTGTGAVTHAQPVFAGTGKMQHTGTGTLANAVPSFSATGIRGNLGTGTLANAVPALSGSGTVAAGGSIIGTGSLAAAVPTMAGTGLRGLLGVGAVTVQSPSFSGTGQQTYAGSGSLAVSLTLSGTGTNQQQVSGTGAIANAVPAFAGSGSVLNPVSGTGTLAVSIPTIDASGSWSTDRTVGQYGAQHDRAYAALLAAEGFEPQHAQAYLKLLRS